MSKLLTVFGATGAQGGSLIRHVLNDPQLSKMFRLRGITRDRSKPAAIELEKEGVEVVRADMDDPESLRLAVAASWAVFAMTNYWDPPPSATREIAQGRAIADACVSSNVHLVIWSSLPHITRISSGKLTAVHHFDSKAEVEDYIRTLPIKSAFYMPGLYMQNLRSDVMGPKLNPDGTLTLYQMWEPTSRVPLIDIDDTGKFVVPILLDPDQYHHKRFTCATAFYTPIDIVDTWSRISGRTVNFVQNTTGGYGDLPEFMQVQLRKSVGLITEWAYYGPTGQKDLEWTLEQMKEKPTSWEEWLRENGPWFEDKK